MGPGTALIAFVIALVVVATVAWPRRGVWPRLRQVWRLSERVRLEDALKHLSLGEHEQVPRSIESLAGVLGVSRSRAVDLLGRLEQMGLVRSGAAGIELTDDGRRYALRIIRTHRLWERYLADETSLAPAEWHDAAEVREHSLSESEVERLAARMGHPLYDPHGDPIPTAAGELPPLRGVPLTALEPGQRGTVVHVEDEPPAVFAQLVAVGFTPLARVEVLERSDSAVRVRVDGQEGTVAPVVAAQVTLDPLPEAAMDEDAGATMADLAPGESAIVVRISSHCQGRQRRRLLDLGLVPGTLVRAELDSALHDPVGYRIRGALIALRRRQAEVIHVRRADGAT